MSSPVIPLHRSDDESPRSAVIAEVRAEMGRQRVNASELGRVVGPNQQYWSRRLTGHTAFDIDDLAALSSVLQVPMSRFIPDVVAPGPDPKPGRASGGARGARAIYFLDPVGPGRFELPTSTV